MLTTYAVYIRRRVYFVLCIIIMLVVVMHAWYDKKRHAIWCPWWVVYTLDRTSYTFIVLWCMRSRKKNVMLCSVPRKGSVCCAVHGDGDQQSKDGLQMASVTVAICTIAKIQYNILTS